MTLRKDIGPHAIPVLADPDSPPQPASGAPQHAAKTSRQPHGDPMESNHEGTNHKASQQIVHTPPDSDGVDSNSDWDASDSEFDDDLPSGRASNSHSSKATHTSPYDTLDKLDGMSHTTQQVNVSNTPETTAASVEGILGATQKLSVSDGHTIPRKPIQHVETNPFRSNASQNNNSSSPFLHENVNLAAINTSNPDPFNPWATEESQNPPPNKASPEPSTALPPADSSSQPSTNQSKSVSAANASAQLTGQQRNEIYQIRRVRWMDRPTPILTQNANGPCPLLALVNALVLTTPPDLETALVETLRVREQVSLGLLLDAVFDELMSGRRGETAQQLPDVGELYSFLVTLHTGMNVNPRFVSGWSQHNSGSIESNEVGGFEETTEMRLYSTFALPLIHGWLPASQDAASEAFARSAPTFDEAQTILFREDELEEKLGRTQLTPEEQTLFMDLSAIKDFLSTWPTQLTDNGLQTIKSTMMAGDVVILFRNDHFSTLYKEPSSDCLLTLVTDAGYASHEEIVWESLEDISGTKAQMFSGDFRSVTHDANGNIGVQDEEGWAKVTSRSGRKSQGAASATQRPAEGTTAVMGAQEANQASQALAQQLTEQQDHDLALAMQLQEEEDQRQRDEEAARRRNEAATQRMLTQESQQRPAIPPRRNNTAQGAPATSDDSAPPPYEQAAGSRPFHPPRDHPSSEYALREASAYSQQSAAQSSRSRASRRNRNGRGPLIDQIPPGSGGRTPFDPQQGSLQSSAAVADRREGCLVM